MAAAKVDPNTRVFDMAERVIKIPFSQNATEKKTGVILKSGMWVSDVFLKCVTVVGSSSIDVGFEGNPDGLLNGSSCVVAGYFYRDTLIAPLFSGQLGPGGNWVSNSAALENATNDSSKIATAASIDYTINGITYTKAPTDDLWTIAANTGHLDDFEGALLYLDADGAATVQASTGETQSADTLAFIDPVVADKCCIGKITYNMDDGAFDGGVSDLDDVHAVVAYTNAVSGVNDAMFGLSPNKADGRFGFRLTEDMEISYTTSAHAVAGFIYVVVKGQFE